MANAKPQTVKVQNGIVEKIMAYLNLGDGGKLDSFFNRINKTLSREVTALKQNIEVVKFEKEQELSDLKDSLEDAKESLTEAYLNVTPEKVATNQAQVEFMDQYLENIDVAERKVADIEAKIEATETERNERVEELQAQINIRETRIDSISAYNKKK